MLPVYRAISFQSVLEKGGRTKPLLVLVKVEDELKPYVVKLFTTELISARDSVTNEVLGNILAQEFDLPVPKAALIDFDEDFIETITDFELRDRIENADGRLKFGSELITGFLPFSSADFQSFQAKQLMDLDSVFAFDNLIRNADRSSKANLIIRSNDSYLIDHELGFEITPDTFDELTNWNWSQRFYRYHIFYEYLRSSFNKYKTEYFSIFEEYLKRMNINRLDSFLNQLQAAGFSTSKHKIVKDYLSLMKQNSLKFVTLMKALISS